MFKQLTPYFTQSRKGHAALTAAACLVALVAAPSAGATAATPDAGFAITAMKATSASAPRVLGTSASGRVELQRPSAGDAGQVWIPSAAPGASTPLAALSACAQRMSCPFTTFQETAPQHLVNVESGQCLTLATAPVGVATTPCDASGTNDRQRFAWNFTDGEVAATGVPQRFTPLATAARGGLRCLTSAKPTGARTAVRSAACSNHLRWEQQYRFAPLG